MPNSTPCISRVTAAAPARPITRPAAATGSPSRSTSRISSGLAAPSAARTPSSRRRCDTPYDTTPYRPTDARISARTRRSTAQWSQSAADRPTRGNAFRQRHRFDRGGRRKLPHQRADGGRGGRGLTLGADHQLEASVEPPLVAGELVVLGLRLAIVAVLQHVHDDADDLPPGSARGRRCSNRYPTGFGGRYSRANSSLTIHGRTPFV